MQRILWLAYFPLLFLPNFGYDYKTPFGTLELSDYLVGPYILLLLLARQRKRSRFVPICRKVSAPLKLFAIWAVLTTLSIELRYDYLSAYYSTFGLLKFAKVFLYILPGFLTCRLLHDQETHWRFQWSLLAAATIAGTAFWIIKPAEILRNAPIQAYKSNNTASVMLAMLLGYLVACHVYGMGTLLWKNVLRISYVTIILGLFVSSGRSGISTFVFGMLFLLYKRGRIRTTLIVTACMSVLAVTAYYYIPEFQTQVDLTFSPPEEHVQQYNVFSDSIDEGARIQYWIYEGRQFVNAPLLGTGFFHRGGKSGLRPEGSHNFWLQMFLETGLIGGGLILIVFLRMWRQAVYFEKAGNPSGAVVQTMLCIVFLGGMMGEYFYGGIAPLTVFTLYATIGSEPWRHSKNNISGQHTG